MGKKEIEKKGNVLGILSLCFGWLIPLVGVILGIVSLVRKEDNKGLGIAGITVSVFFWILYVTLIMIGYGFAR